MPASRPLPIRVLVKGASLMHDTSERPQHRDHAVFARVLEESLLDSGYDVDIRMAAVASQPLTHAFRTWEQEVKAWAPDVVILSYGGYEAVHLFLPRWLERHANSLKTRPTVLRRLYRNTVVRVVWKVLARTQARLDRIVGARWFHGSAHRFESRLVEYLDRTREVGQPLVVLFEFLQPSPRGQAWFPGMGARTHLINEALERVIAHYDSPDVMLLPIISMATDALPPGELANPDGFHYTARFHRLVGEELADRIRAWAKDQQRFAPR
jgi:hypothetical protein